MNEVIKLQARFLPIFYILLGTI